MTDSDINETKKSDVPAENEEQLTIIIPLPLPDKIFLDDIKEIYSKDFQINFTDDVTLDYLFTTWSWSRMVQCVYNEYFGTGEDAIQSDIAAKSPDYAYQEVLRELKVQNFFEVHEFTKFNPDLKPVPCAPVLWKIAEQDTPNWEILRSMYRDCPDMKFWIRYNFDMWQVCRMYQLYKERPENADILRSIVGDYPYKYDKNSYNKFNKNRPNKLTEEEFKILEKVLNEKPDVKFGHFCEFIPYKELYDIISLDDDLTQSFQKTSWNNAESEELKEWSQDLVAAGITKIAKWNPWRGRRNYIWINSWLTFAHETTKYSPYGDNKTPLTLLLSPDIPDKLFSYGRYWREFNDCGLARQAPHAKPLMVQTFPGFCYRFFKEKYGEVSAEKMFTMRVDAPGNVQRLKQELGTDLYKKDFGHVIEWIPYENLSNVKYMTHGGFGNIYTAEWNPQQNVDLPRKQRQLSGDDPVPVALKYIFNAENITESFLRELNIVVHALSAYPLGFVKVWGLSRRPVPKTIESVSEKNSLPPSNAVLLVLEFATHGTLREFLSSKKSMSWKEKINTASLIATGINRALHAKGIAHRDLHSGNILMLNVPDGNTPTIRGCVTDVGLSGYVRSENTITADEQSGSGVIGVLPYIAPEVLRGESYTLAADVYSFGIILWQIAAKRLPFCYRAHDISLKNDICYKGLRERRIPHVPKDYEDMYMRCWDEDPKKRPTIDDVMWELERLSEDIMDGKLSIDDEGAADYNDGSEEIDNNPDNPRVTHPNAVYHSRLYSSECTMECVIEDSEICWQPLFTIDQ